MPRGGFFFVSIKNLIETFVMSTKTLLNIFSSSENICNADFHEQ